MILNAWHNWLDMKQFDRQWHVDDIADELQEYREARGLVDRWSELSDVVYTTTRARWVGFDDVPFPLARWQYYIGMIYMFPKYTLRWLFFRRVGRRFGKEVHEVRNPRKVHKLCTIAKRYDIDAQAFTKMCEHQMKFWVFLK